MEDVTTHSGDLVAVKQNVENIQTLCVCLEGGGIRGLAYIGVSRALEELGFWNFIKTFIGSSAGSIFASLKACKISQTDLEKELEITDFNKFLDGYSFEEPFRFYENFGLFPGTYFLDWIGKVLEKFVGDKDITFQEVYEKFGNILIITGTNLSLWKPAYFSRDTEPDMPIRLAVRISMSVPIIFEPVIYKGMTFIDGGVLNNFPSDVLKTGNILGFKLISDDKPPYSIKNVSSFISNLIECPSQIIEDLRDTETKQNIKTIYIKTLDIKTLEFDISKERLKKLIDEGYKGTIESFNTEND